MGSNIPGTEGLPAPLLDRPPLPPPRFGTHITVLSIDGGGIRGLIPTVIVASLEEMLQDIDEDPEARIADYFDVIAGTSTGALLTACLVTPNQENPARPLYAAKDIKKFYQEEGPNIFPPRKQDGILYRFCNWITMGLLAKVSFLKHILTGGPRYDGKHLRDTIMRLTGGVKFDEALTTVVVPTFDIEMMSPSLFYSVKNNDYVSNLPHYDVLLSDVLIGTTAAPTYFPAHRATLHKEDARISSDYSIAQPGCRQPVDRHLIDGGVVANNPTMLGISHATREILRGHSDYPSYQRFSYGNAVVISLGTGAVKHKATGTYTAEECAKWSTFDWIYKKTNGHTPLLDVFSSANDMLVDLYTTAFLESHLCSNYLRIQSQDKLEGPTAFMDCATEDNMNELINIGEELLQKYVHRVNLLTGLYEQSKYDFPIDGGRTNQNELRRYARILSKERKERLENFYPKNRDNHERSQLPATQARPGSSGECPF